MSKIIKGNKGEWSEFYTLLKLLADGNVYAADENLKKIENKFYPILSITRYEKGNKELNYEISESDVLIDSEIGNSNNSKVSRYDLRAFAKKILDAIIEHGETFVVDGASDIMSQLHCNSLKAGSKDKADIQLKIHDFHINDQRKVGFSIKSQLGGNPTLLNASSHTTFSYKVDGINWDITQKANSIDTHSKIIDRLNYISTNGGSLSYVLMPSITFKKNLRKIDSFMDEIVADLLKNSYLLGIKNISELVYNPNFLESMGKYDFDGSDIEHKIKNLLAASALGMTPSSIWNGRDEIYGGYLIVREDGEIVCYHVFNRDQFYDYLFRSVKFESPSTSRYGYGKFYLKNGEIFFDLNMQIRFI